MSSTVHRLGRRFRHAGAAVLVGICGLASIPPVTAGSVVPHRALYRIHLDRATEASGIVGAAGEMAMEWSDACEGWTLKHVFRLQLVFSQHDSTETSVSLSTWEAKDGASFRFFVRRTVDGVEAEMLSGRATRGKSGRARARFEEPEQKEIELPVGTLFPTQHTEALVAAAEMGKRLFTAPVFDGSEMASADEVSAAIGRLLPPPDEPTTDGLRDGPSWRMRLAYYQADGRGAEPEFEIEARLFDNGVVDDFLIDYGTFRLAATPERIEALPRC